MEDPKYLADLVQTFQDRDQVVVYVNYNYNYFYTSPANLHQHSGVPTMTGDHITFSGPITSSIINIKSTLTNVSQQFGAAPALPPDNRAKLQKLVEELSQNLEEAAKSHPEAAEAVADAVRQIGDQTKKEKPNKISLKLACEMLTAAALAVKEVVPAAVTIAGQISEVIHSTFG